MTALPLLLSRPLIYSCAIPLGIGLSLLHPSSPFRQSRLQCQYVAPAYSPHASSTETGWAFPVEAKQGRTTTTSTRGQGILTASSMRQISLGSVLGLAVGLGLRVFSKALVFFLGVGVVLVEWAASKGYYIFPVRRVQKYVKGVDLERVLTENMAFKTSFGMTMAMAAFARF